MHLEVYVEEPSAKEALVQLLPRILRIEHSFAVHPFRGKQQLLSEVPKRLRGYSRWIPDDWRVVVLVDEDREDCRALKQRLVAAASNAGLVDRVLCRVAVEELEAWFLGDVKALRAAFPNVPSTLANRAGLRDPDAVRGGTWEALDRILRRAGYRQGLVKTAAAREIAMNMDPELNCSHSFCMFRDGIRRLTAEV
jgi:hypothetical protein